MDYSKFKGKQYKKVSDEYSLPIIIILDIISVIMMGILIFLSLEIIKMWIFDFVPVLVITTPFIIFVYILSFSILSSLSKITYFLIGNIILNRQTETIRKRLLINELPFDVDLADYFKQREIELLESEVKGDFDLLKSMYLRDEVLNEL